MSQAHADCPHCRQDGSEAKHIALKEVRIALAGNPNCGKTTAFNEYTGTHQHVGNYPGVTVDKKEGYVSIDGVEVLMVDLPGTYSLTAYCRRKSSPVPCSRPKGRGKADGGRAIWWTPPRLSATCSSPSR